MVNMACQALIQIVSRSGSFRSQAHRLLLLFALMIIAEMTHGDDSVSPLKAEQGIDFQVSGPTEPKVDVPEKYSVRFVNRGLSPIDSFDVEVRYSSHAKLVSSTPTAKTTSPGTPAKAVFEVPFIPGGSAREIQLIMESSTTSPVELLFTAHPRIALRWKSQQAPTKSVTLDLRGPLEMSVGERSTVEVHLKNTGSLPIKNGGLSLQTSTGIKLVTSAERARPAFDIPAGGSLMVPIEIEGTSGGPAGIIAKVLADPSVKLEKEILFDIARPRLAVWANAPSTAIVGQTIQLRGSVELGEAEEESPPVRCYVELPANVDFVSASDNGIYDESRRFVVWNLASSGAGERTELSVDVRPRLPGLADVRWSARLGEDFANSKKVALTVVQAQSPSMSAYPPVLNP